MIVKVNHNFFVKYLTYLILKKYLYSPPSMYTHRGYLGYYMTRAYLWQHRHVNPNMQQGTLEHANTNGLILRAGLDYVKCTDRSRQGYWR
jgi:hypothetical protein